MSMTARWKAWFSRQALCGSVAAATRFCRSVSVGQLFLGVPLRRAGRREPVDVAVELVVVAHHRLVQRADERAAVRLDGHPALALQAEQRLAHRHPAQPQHLGDRVLRNPVALRAARRRRSAAGCRARHARRCCAAKPRRAAGSSSPVPKVRLWQPMREPSADLILDKTLQLRLRDGSTAPARTGRGR